MTRHSRAVLRKAAATAAAFVVALAVSSAAGASPGPSRHKVSTQLTYDCVLPSDPTTPHPVDVDIRATVPTSGSVAQSLQVTDITLNAQLPAPLLEALGMAKGTEVAGQAQLGFGIEQRGATSDGSATLTIDDAAVRPTSSLMLSASGDMTPATVNPHQDVVLSAAKMFLSLKGDKLASGKAVSLACAPQPGQDTTIAGITAPDSTAESSVSKPPKQSSQGNGPNGNHTTTSERHSAKKHAASTTDVSGIPDDCGDGIEDMNRGRGCAYLYGLSNVSKLHAATRVGRGKNADPPATQVSVQANIDAGTVINFPEPTEIYTCSIAQLHYNGKKEFPPTRATFLTFGFMPVSATMHLSETKWPENHQPVDACRPYSRLPPPPDIKDPVITIYNHTIADLANHYPQHSEAETYLSLRLSDVTVNGEPLDVGNHCTASHSIHSVLTGNGYANPDPPKYPAGYRVLLGGTLSGQITIPSFTGCGVGEDLDPLLDATISGAKNYLKIAQGKLCTIHDFGPGPNCPPNIPKPIR